jgi:hypothetical protein
MNIKILYKASTCIKWKAPGILSKFVIRNIFLIVLLMLLIGKVDAQHSWVYRYAIPLTYRNFLSLF